MTSAIVMRLNTIASRELAPGTFEYSSCGDRTDYPRRVRGEREIEATPVPVSEE